MSEWSDESTVDLDSVEWGQRPKSLRHRVQRLPLMHGLVGFGIVFIITSVLLVVLPTPTGLLKAQPPGTAGGHRRPPRPSPTKPTAAPFASKKAPIEPGAERSIFVTLDVTGDCLVTLKSVELSPAKPPLAWRRTPTPLPALITDLPPAFLTSTGPSRFNYAAVIGPEQEALGLVIPDPRHVQHFDTEGHTAVEQALLGIYFPASTQTATLYCTAFSSNTALELDLTPKRSVAPSMDTSDTSNIVYRPIAEVGPPSEQINIIFVSAGYVESEMEKFFDHVARAYRLMQDETLTPNIGNIQVPENLRTMRRSAPHSRYLEFWNIYAVFQPSPESGATRKKFNIIRNNNLDCE